MALPSDVQLLTEPDTTRLVLPTRVRTGPIWLGLVPVFFGLIFSGFALFWIINALDIHAGRPVHAPAPAVVGPEDAGPRVPGDPLDAVPAAGFQWENLFFALFGLPFLVVGLFPLGLGILMFFPSHAEVIISDDMLIAVDQMGPVRFRRRRAIGGISKLRVGQIFEKSQDEASSQRSYCIFAEMAAAADTSVPAPMRVAARYPRATLTPLAEFILGELKRRGSTSVLHTETDGAAAGELSLTIDPEPAAPVEAEEPVIPQPEESKIQFIPTPDALTFIIPRTGFRGTARFFLTFSLFWNTLSFTFFGIMLYQLIHEPSMENLGILGFLSIFVAIGTATALAAVQTAFRKSVILATRESLVFTQTGPIRSAEFQWIPAEISAIRCANSSTSVNHQPLKELQIEHTGDKNPKFRRLMTGREEDELLWMASALRGFYRVRG